MLVSCTKFSFETISISIWLTRLLLSFIWYIIYISVHMLHFILWGLNLKAFRFSAELTIQHFIRLKRELYRLIIQICVLREFFVVTFIKCYHFGKFHRISCFSNTTGQMILWFGHNHEDTSFIFTQPNYYGLSTFSLEIVCWLKRESLKLNNFKRIKILI